MDVQLNATYFPTANESIDPQPCHAHDTGDGSANVLLADGTKHFGVMVATADIANGPHVRFEVPTLTEVAQQPAAMPSDPADPQ